MAADLHLSSENPYSRRSVINAKVQEADGVAFSESQDADEEKCTCSHSGEAEIFACTKPCCKNIGREILKKQGWKAGRGLGKDLQGVVDPPPLKVITSLDVNTGISDVTDTTTEQRRILECEREPTHELAAKYEENAEKEKARQASLQPLKSPFYCTLCDKQYLQHDDFDNHINSYDHAHVKRLKDLKQQHIRAQLSGMRLRDDKNKEKDLKRITEFALARAERGSEEGEGTVDADCTTVFYDDDTPDMPPLPMGVNIMDTVCPDSIPLPPDPNTVHTKSDSSDSEHSPGKDNTTELGGHSAISFAVKGKQSSALPGQSIFKEEEAANRRKLIFPRRKKILQKKQPALSFVPKSDENEKGDEQAEAEREAEREAEELYPSQPTVEDARQKPHFKKMTFVQSTVNLGGAKAEMNVLVGPPNKHDLLQFVKVTRLEDDGQLDWPAEMIQTSKSSTPALLYSCNPLMFDFGLLTGKPKAKPTAVKVGKKDKKKKKSKKHKKKSRSRSSKRNEKDEKEDEQVAGDGKTEKKSIKKKSKKKSKQRRPKKVESDTEDEEEKKPTDETTQKTMKKSKKRRRKSSKRTKKMVKKTKESASETDPESDENKAVTKEISTSQKSKSQTPKKTKKVVKKKKKVCENVESGESEGEAVKTKSNKKQYRKRNNSATQQVSDGDLKTVVKKKKPKKKGAIAATVPTKAEATASNKTAQKRVSDTNIPGGKKRVKLEQEDGGRVSDFEGAKDKGQGKWETSSDSELENIVKTETKNKKTVRTKKVNGTKSATSLKNVKASESSITRRSRKDSEVSDKRSSRRSHHSSSSRDRSRSYSDDSYYSYSSRSRSDSRDSRYYTSSDYYTDYSSRSRSRSYRSRSRGRRHHRGSYTSTSRSRSRSRSYSCDRRSRSYSRRRSYSRSSRSYTRSRSRHRTRSRSRRRLLQSSPDPRFSSLKRPQNNKLRRQLSKKPFKPGPIRPIGINGEIQPLMDKIIPKPGEKAPSQSEDQPELGSPDSSSLTNTSAKKVNTLEGDRPRPAMSEDERKKREKLIQDIAARMEKEAEEAEKAIKDKVQSVTKPETIPIPAPHQSHGIPLPTQPALNSTIGARINTVGAGGVFIGPLAPGTSNIPLPSTAKFQYIGPDDPLVFKKSSGGASDEQSKPGSAPPGVREKKDGSSFLIPPEQAEKYKALQDQVRKHLARQRGEVVESSDDEENATETTQNDDGDDEITELTSPGLDEAQLLAHLTPQLVPIAGMPIAGMPLQAGQPVMISASHAQAIAMAQQAQAIQQQAQYIQAAQMQAMATQQAQAQMAAQQQAMAMAQGQVLMQPQMGQSTLVQTAQGLMRVPTAAMQPQLITGAQLQQLQLQRAMAAQQQGAVLMRGGGGGAPMLVRLPVQRPM